uniref:spermine oxidase-like n=1 Tax=Ciona intestinalis TaxID=7719 RepID=UPI000180CE3D|nr:spermine oxidase-like [Ciona intestinalis]|eukprot:XP_002132119.1 spermine oxidase-like [Ciona intestinalis]
MSSIPSITIIGAGISGLSAAQTLYKNGFTDITILEARDRIGGRINTVKKGDFKFQIEEGAQWLHGDKNNPLENVTQSNKIRKTLSGECTKFFSTNGSLTPHEQNVINKGLEYFKVLLKKLFDKEHKKLPLSCDVLSYLKNEWMKIYAGHTPVEKRLLEKLFKCLHNQECLLDGCSSLAQASLPNYNKYLELEGGNYTFDDGFAQVVNAVAEIIPSKNIQLNSVVTTIEWNIPNKSYTSESKVVVRYSLNGESHRVESDHVIVTLPLGCLKKLHKTMFNPPLPKSKASVINSIGFGILNKVILYYEEQFWEDDVMVMNLLWDELNDGNKFGIQIVNFHVLQDARSGKSYLVGWASGDNAVKLERMSDEEISDVCTDLFRKCFGKEVSRPDAIYVTRWHSDPFSLGSYSYAAVNSNAEDNTVLAEPVVGDNNEKPQILFAGEATHPTFFSTVHGAYESGKREAERIIGMGYKIPSI